MPVLETIGSGSAAGWGASGSWLTSYASIADILSNGLLSFATAEGLTAGSSYTTLTPKGGSMGGTYISRIGGGTGSPPYDNGTSGSVPVVNWGSGKAFDQRSSGTTNYGWRSTADVGITGQQASTMIVIGEVNSSTGSPNGSSYHISLNFGNNGTNNTRAIASTGVYARDVWYSQDTIHAIGAGIGVKNVYVVRNTNNSINFRWNTKSETETGSVVVYSGATYNTTGPSKLYTQWRDDNGNQYPYGYIAEWMLFNRELSDSEVTRIINYGKAKYGFS
jgi:hypothetical protein